MATTLIHILKTRALAPLAAGVFVLVLASGCQSLTEPTQAHAAVSEECPVCHMQCQSTTIEGLTYEKCVCPTCGKVTNLGAGGAKRVQQYVGDPAVAHVPCCTHCESIIAECPNCRLSH